jgi:Spy/CpxP family protein refolding chaperone
MPSLAVLACALALTLAAPLALAQHHGHSGRHSPYAGMETREIKSLSPADIEELRRGGGWGLALPAELNGVPGPAHLLELKAELGLSPDQVAKIEASFAAMKAEAIPAGERLIAAERGIEAAFASGRLDAARLRELVMDAEKARAELRVIHLARHLEMPPLLTSAQIARYKVLRGYAADPCAAVPAGHDPAMWRRHNNCK